MLITGGEAVVRCLTAHGVDTVFGIPGTHNLSLYEAIRQSGSLRHILTRHEQGAAFMADGYARASGREGVCISTSGPALLNTATSLGTAYCDSSPLLCIASQIPSEGIGKQKGYIHECRDQLACIRPVTTWSARADTPSIIPELIHEAFVRMRSGRPRPVVIEIPSDVLDAHQSVEFPSPVPTPRVQPDPKSVRQAVELIRQSRRPVIWAGHGVIISDASEILIRLAEHLDAPVFSTVLGKGAIPEDHPLAAGSALPHPAAQTFLKQYDLVLAVGTRFTQEESDNWTLPLPQLMIHIEIDPEEIGRNYQPSVAVVGDARESMLQIHNLLSDLLPEKSGVQHHKVAGLRRQIRDDLQASAPQGVALIDTLESVLPRNSIIVSDLCIGAYWCRRLLNRFEPRTQIYPWGFCTLGFGLPAAIGAQVAQAKQPVVVLSGDGGFLFNCQELATARQYGIPIIVLIFNNQSYEILKIQQQTRYDHPFEVDMVNPDFVMLAESFGAVGRRVTSFTQLKKAIHEALSSEDLTVIDVTVDIPLPLIEPGMRAMCPELKTENSCTSSVEK